VDDLVSLRDAFRKECTSVNSLAGLQKLKAQYLGKKGLVTEKLKALSAIAPEQRPAYGKAVNEIKIFLEEELRRTESLLKEREYQESILSEALDVTLPGKFTPPGSEHPIQRVLSEITGIFSSMGFEVGEGPEVELDYYNFEALNMPRNHPARDMQDTFYISDDVVLRTHTSPVQIRVMEKRTPPLKIVAPGKVYRCDADVSHTPMFHQVEGFMVDTDISFSDLKGVLHTFVEAFFERSLAMRFRPSYFPFTEPSAEVDIGWEKGGAEPGWLEILGCGMVHPNVLRGCDVDPEIYTGYAFGMGIERLAMLRYGVSDLRLFFENDLQFLRQFV